MNVTDICRVCLCGDRRMYAMSNTVLRETWEKLTNAKEEDVDIADVECGTDSGDDTPLPSTILKSILEREQKIGHRTSEYPVLHLAAKLIASTINICFISNTDASNTGFR
ncbi:hypothetical protein K1T71_000564 [Dendrolimus kikuchii]|uniref:Uncharacterized protein n=1 Tax=Dendrolimus kikuchii TaxID=765133 RepID=A0ACC1DKU5_9NEOP|nr:hypothetical protein K1T71_000564 [Dendrolimus kikuchii]